MISNIMAGILIAVINVTVAISVAALMFSGFGPEYLATGITILLVGTVVLGLGGTGFSAFGGIIVAPRSGLAPVFAGLVAGVAGSMAASGQGQDALPTIIVTVMIATAFAGAFLWFLGAMRLGGLVRYIPYPVMGGFFAGIGLIFVKGGLSVATGQAVALDNWRMLLDPSVLALAAPAVVFAVTLYWAQRRFDHWAVFPVLLILAASLFYGGLALGGVSTADALAGGWLPNVMDSRANLPILDLDRLGEIHWPSVIGQAGAILVVALLCAIILLLDVSGVEIITGHALTPDRELKVAGLTNLVNGLLGGFPGVHVASDTAFTFKLGGDRRLMGLVYAGCVSLVILAGTGPIGTVPLFILAGCLVYVGIDFLIDWAWATREKLPLTDYLVVLAILMTIAFTGILEGVAFGFAIAVVLFVINYSRLSIIKNALRGHEHASHVERDLATRELLNTESRRIFILRLQGFIFFGTADSLLEAVRGGLADEPETIYVVLDFQHVSQLDTSAVQAFSKLARLADQTGFHVAIASVTSGNAARLEAAGFFTGQEGGPSQRVRFDHMDDAIAWCEDHLLEKQRAQLATNDHAVAGRLTALLEDPDAAAQVVPYFKPMTVTADSLLFRQGDSGDALYLIHEGSAAVVITLDNGQQRVLRVFQAGAVLGEMALYTGEPRSAAVRMEEDGVVLRLAAADMEEMQRAAPRAAGLFHRFVVRLLAERLDRANRELQRYQ